MIFFHQIDISCHPATNKVKTRSVSVPVLLRSWGASLIESGGQLSSVSEARTRVATQLSFEFSGAAK